MVDEPEVTVPTSTTIGKKPRPTDADKQAALENTVAPTVSDAPGARIIEERTLKSNEDLGGARREAVEAASKRAQAAGMTSFTCEYTETGPTTFQIEAKRIG